MTPTQAALAALRGRTRLINATAEEIAQLLAQAEQQVRDILAEAPSDYQRWLLPQLQAEIRRVLAAAGDDAAAVADQGQVRAWRGGQALVDEVVRGNGIAVVMPMLDQVQLDAMRAFLTEKIRDVSIEAANRINSQLGLVVIGAQTPFEAVQQIADLVDADQRRASSIVYTELGRAFSTANQIRMEQFAEVVPGMKKRWAASGKARPRIEHLVIDGQEVPVDEPFVLEGGAVRMMYPHDPAAPAKHTINCGCVAVPVVPGYRRTVESPNAEEAERARNALRR